MGKGDRTGKKGNRASEHEPSDLRPDFAREPAEHGKAQFHQAMLRQ